MARQIVLSHRSLAKLASGTPLAQVEHEEIEDPPQTPAAALEAPVVPQEPGAPAAPAAALEAPVVPQEPGASAAPAAALEPPAAPAAEGATDMVAFLKGELAEARTALSAAQVEKMQLEAKLATAQADHAGLLACTVNGAALLQNILGQTPAALDGLPAASVVTQYTAHKQAYESQFKIGQQTVPDAATGDVELTGESAALAAGLRPVK